MKASGFLPLFLLVLCVGATLQSGNAQDEQIAGTRKVTTKIVPVYPPLARQMSLTGTVKLQVVVAANGQPKSIEVKGGSPVPAQAAQQALHNWRWEKADHDSAEIIQFNFHP